MTKEREKRKHEQQVETDDGAKSSAEQGVVSTSNPVEKIEELADLVKSLIHSQAARDQQMEKDDSCQEHRWRSMQDQFQQILLQVNEIKQDSRGE